MSDSSLLKDARKAAKEEAWMYEGESAGRTADFMVQTLERLEKEADTSQKKSA